MTTIPEAHPGGSRRWSQGRWGQSRWNPLHWDPAALAQLSPASTLRYTFTLYLVSRLLFLLIAGIDAAVYGTSLGSTLSNWDGYWYLQTSEHWYLHHVFHHAGEYSTLGFMPLYPMAMWLVAHVTQIGELGAGLAISLIAGFVATVQISKLASQWWGEQAARRAILFWCFFPGTVVFSMVYTEALTLALVTTAMLLLTRKRWLWAGVCCGFATAIAPVALASIVMCAVAAGIEIWQRGSRRAASELGSTAAAALASGPPSWRDVALRTPRGRQVWRRGITDRVAQRSLIAPILSTVGVVAFAVFLWFWTGSPTSDYTAQHVAWSESTTPLAIPRVFGSLIHQMYISGVGNHGPGGIDLNGIAALVGTVFLFWGFWLMWRNRARIPVIVWVWTVVVALMALTSSHTPPNPRMLIVAFPVVIAAGAATTGRRYRRVVWYGLLVTVVMTPLTYVGIWLRP